MVGLRSEDRTFSTEENRLVCGAARLVTYKNNSPCGRLTWRTSCFTGSERPVSLPLVSKSQIGFKVQNPNTQVQFYTAKTYSDGFSAATC